MVNIWIHYCKPKSILLICFTLLFCWAFLTQGKFKVQGKNAHLHKMTAEL